MEQVGKFKYLRIQGAIFSENTMYQSGVFNIFNQMLQEEEMEEEDADLYREIDDWFAEKLPWPECCKNREKVVCFFKTENAAEMVKMIRPALWLLERYKKQYFVVYTNNPGEIVYEDKYQVAVKVSGQIEFAKPIKKWLNEE